MSCVPPQSSRSKSKTTIHNNGFFSFSLSSFSSPCVCEKEKKKIVQCSTRRRAVCILRECVSFSGGASRGNVALLQCLNNRSSTRMQNTTVITLSSESSSSSNSKDMTMVRLSRRRPFGLRFLLAVPVLSVIFFVSYVGWTDLIEWRSSCSNLMVVHNSELINSSSSSGSVEKVSSIALQSLLAYSRALSEPSSAGRRCISPTASQVDIDTFDIYPQLDFQVNIHLIVYFKIMIR